MNELPKFLVPASPTSSRGGLGFRKDGVNYIISYATTYVSSSAVKLRYVLYNADTYEEIRTLYERSGNTSTYSNPLWNSMYNVSSVYGCSSLDLTHVFVFGGGSFDLAVIYDADYDKYYDSWYVSRTGNYWSIYDNPYSITVTDKYIYVPICNTNDKQFRIMRITRSTGSSTTLAYLSYSNSGSLAVSFAIDDYVAIYKNADDTTYGCTLYKDGTVIHSENTNGYMYCIFKYEDVLLYSLKASGSTYTIYCLINGVRTSTTVESSGFIINSCGAVRDQDNIYLYNYTRVYKIPLSSLTSAYDIVSSAEPLFVSNINGSLADPFIASTPMVQTDFAILKYNMLTNSIIALYPLTNSSTSVINPYPRYGYNMNIRDVGDGYYTFVHKQSSNTVEGTEEILFAKLV